MSAITSSVIERGLDFIVEGGAEGGNLMMCVCDRLTVITYGASGPRI